VKGDEKLEEPRLKDKVGELQRCCWRLDAPKQLSSSYEQLSPGDKKQKNNKKK
jgi:hypothetical protein